MKTRERMDLELIDDNPWQPRQAIDEDALQELADSIRQLGLLQAPLGRRDEISGRYQLAFGHRRVAGCRLLLQQGRGESHIDMDVDEISDEGMAVLALTENERRKQLSQIEVVRAHHKAINETNLTIQTLADQLGIDRSTLSNHLRVLDLPDFVLEHVESGKLSVSVAREFLVFQTATHQHTEDMQEVIRRIVNVETYGGGVPDWRRRKHVRKMISEAVSYNEKEWRPLGLPTAHSTGGGRREAAFDRDEFVWEYRDNLHTIPADDGHIENYRPTELYDKSRQWTCEVKEWSRRQASATREANKEAEASGGTAPATSSKSGGRDKQFESALAKDPVMKQVAAAREKKGPSRPVDAAEKEQLGTRAALRDISGNTVFWKILEPSNLDARPNKYAWSREQGGSVPPWFPDLDECRRCTIGAAYAKSRDGYTLRDVTLVCMNQEHYQEKLQAGEAAYREKTEAHQKGIDRQDAKAVKQLTRQLEPLTDDACQVLAASLVAANPALAWANPLGFYDADWSHESGLGELVRDLLGSESLVATWNNRGGYGPVINADSIAALSGEGARKLAAALMTHHLRLAGKMETVSRETVTSD